MTIAFVVLTYLAVSTIVAIIAGRSIGWGYGEDVSAEADECHSAEWREDARREDAETVGASNGSQDWENA